MHFIPLSDIEIRERQREIDRGIVNLLRDSIPSKGLFHAVVVGEDEESPHFLIGGEHRIEAIRELHQDKVEFFYNKTLVPKGCVPCVYLNEMSAADILEAELEENIIRAVMPWPQRTMALAKIYELRQETDPTHNFQKEAAILQEKGDTRHKNYIATEVKNASILAKHLDRPHIAKARNQKEALSILYKEEAATLEAEIIRRKQKAAEEMGVDGADTGLEVVHGSLYEILPELQEGTFDLILADPVYGIGADSAGFRSRTKEHHNYDDSVEEANKMLKAILVEGFRICKNRANLFMFGDIDMFQHFKQQASAMGWKPFRTPIIWQKSKSEGLAPWGREGPRRTYEMLFFATKGGKGLLQSPTDILDASRVPRNKRRYGAEKPIPLLRQLIECSTMPGDHILDPCCGAGTTLAAARELNRRCMGIELDEGAYNMAVVAAVRDPYTDEPDGPVNDLEELS